MTFDEWFNELEVFSMRGERFLNDLDHHVEGSEGSNKRMIEWLRAAYKVGLEQGKSE